MTVPGRESVSVSDVDEISQTPRALGMQDDAVGGSQDRLTRSCGEVDRTMQGSLTRERIGPVPEAAGQDATNRTDRRCRSRPISLLLQATVDVVELTRQVESSPFEIATADAGLLSNIRRVETGDNGQLMGSLLELGETPFELADAVFKILIDRPQLLILIDQLGELPLVHGLGEEGPGGEEGGTEQQDKDGSDTEDLSVGDPPLPESGPGVGYNDNGVVS